MNQPAEKPNKLSPNWHKMLPANPRMAFFPSKPVTVNKYQTLRKLAKDISPTVQLRLEWIIFYETIAKRDATYTANHFNISRKTFHKWHKRFKESKCKVSSLKNKSKTPHTKRKWEVTPIQEDRICNLRKKHMLYGKKKLKKLYKRFHNQDISTWKIERVVRKHKLYPDPVKHKRTQAKRARSKAHPRTRVKDLPKAKSFGCLWHVDSIIENICGTRRAIITSIDDVTRVAYARMYPSNTSKYAKDFIQRLLYITDNNVQIVHTDNGSEFDGHFAKAVKELTIPQVYSRPYTPKDNGMNERFNRTLQEEWLYGAVFDPLDLTEANKQLTRWLIEYNTYRPHESLDQDTPVEYVESTLKVLPMYSARTFFEFKI